MKQVPNKGEKKWNLKDIDTSILLESSVRVTFDPTFAATNPGNEVPAPSCKTSNHVNNIYQHDYWLMISWMRIGIAYASTTFAPEKRYLCCQTYSARITLQGHTNSPYSSFIFWSAIANNKQTNQ